MIQSNLQKNECSMLVWALYACIELFSFFAVVMYVVVGFVVSRLGKKAIVHDNREKFIFSQMNWRTMRFDMDFPRIAPEN